MARFVKPTIDEIREYIAEIGADIDPENYWNYYEARGWMAGKSRMKDWKASVRVWAARQTNRGKAQQESAYETECDGLKFSERQAAEAFLMKRTKGMLDRIGALPELQKCESPIERQLYIGLCIIIEVYRVYGITIESQYKLGDTGYRADFMMMIGGTRLIVECDGHDWHRASQEQVNHDYKRERAIVHSGYDIIRYTGSEINADAFECAKNAVGTLIQLHQRRRNNGGG